jgi:hypothetical protein
MRSINRDAGIVIREYTMKNFQDVPHSSIFCTDVQTEVTSPEMMNHIIPNTLR